MNAILSLALIFLFVGCGNATEPKTETKVEVLSITDKKDEIVQDKNNTTVTHIRVLEFDPKSKIPEHLVKLPIYQDKKYEEKRCIKILK